MRFPLIYRYVAREILSPFWISLFVLTGVLFLARSLKLVELVVNKNVPASDMILLFSFIVPRFLELAFPMSLLLAIIMAFGRLSSDSELVVIRATGVSLKMLALPVMGFSFVTMLIAFLLSFYITPWANHQLGEGMFEIARTQASAGLSAGTFNELGQMTIYAESIEEQGSRLNNVLIADRRDPEVSRTFIAKYGKIVSDKQKRSLTLQLFDGSIPEGSGLTFNITYFDINHLSLPHSELLGEQETRSGKKSGELFVHELASYIDELKAQPASEDDEHRIARYQVELHRRFALPVSCLCIGLIAMALGIQPSRGGHTWGASMNVGAGIFLILVYYLLFALASAIGEQGKAPAWLVMWVPNLLFALSGVYLFRKMGSEQWLAVSQAVVDGFRNLGERVSRLARVAAQEEAA